MDRRETFRLAHVIWFVSAVYLTAGPGFAYAAAVVGFGLAAAGFGYAAFRDGVAEVVRRRMRR
jgi:hypothetical protein